MKNKSPQKYQPPLPAESKPKRAELRVEKHSYYEGPLPHPETLAQFKVIDESLPERIVRSFEAEGNHRRSVENKVVNFSFITQLSGTFSALLAVGMVCYLGYLFMEKGYADEARWIICTVVVGLAAAFLGRSSKKKSNDKE